MTRLLAQKKNPGITHTTFKPIDKTASNLSDPQRSLIKGKDTQYNPRTLYASLKTQGHSGKLTSTNVVGQTPYQHDVTG